MQYVMPFLLAMAVTMAALPLLGRLAQRFAIVDYPGVRKVHTRPIPRVGGLAMACGVTIAALVVMKLEPRDLWFLAGAGVLTVFGAMDDRYDLNYRVKLVGQLLAVTIVVFGGHLQIQTMSLDERLPLPVWLSMPLTVVFLVGITNAINLADGLDGLAGGTTFLCLCALAMLSSLGEHTIPAAMALAFAGAVLGFLRFNTFPASVFMGDAGSQLLGFAVGVLSIRATQSATSPVSAALPLLLLGLPILDTLSVMVQRLSEGRSPFTADKNHIHHKLLALGLGHHEAVMVIYAAQAVLFLLAYTLRFESDWLILLVVCALFCMTIAALQIAARRSRATSEAARDRHTSPLTRWLSVLRRPQVLPRWSFAAIAGALVAYALLVALTMVSPGRDVQLLIWSLLTLMVLTVALRQRKELALAEKACLYVIVTILVYLDTSAAPAARLLSALNWAAVATALAATALRLRLLNDRRFQLTPLDLIVLFVALVVPNLPDNTLLPRGGGMGVAKLVILLYSLEMLVSRDELPAVWMRLGAIAVLAALGLRSLLPG